MNDISRTILIIDEPKRLSGTGFLLGPRLAVTAAHIVQSKPPHILALTSTDIESLEPGQLHMRSVPATKVTRFGSDIALLEFEKGFHISRSSRIVMTEPGQMRSLIVHVKGYADRYSEIDKTQSTYIPAWAEAQLTPEQMHGGKDGGFPLPLRMFTDPAGYKGMSGAVLTYLGEPLAIQHKAWPGPPAVPEFRRLDLLANEARKILEHHAIGTLLLPNEGPHLEIVEDSDYVVPEPLPVPIVAVESEFIDSVRTHDFTSPLDDSSMFRLQPLDLDGLASDQLKQVLIEAPAGFGKTFLLRRTAANLSQGLHTFFVTCNRIPAEVFKTASASDLLNQVVAEGISPEAATRFLESGSSQQRRLLVLDGLNEIGIDQDAIQRLLRQARVAENLTTLASQRPAITQAPPEGYTFGFLLPLDPQFVEKLVGAVDPVSMRLLRIPLFLELKKAEGIEAKTQVDAARTYFEQCLLGLERFRRAKKLLPQAREHLLAPAFRSIGQAATEIYRQKRSTVADEQFFRESELFTDIGGVDQALEAGFLVRDGDLLRFRHQLFHDWAVAKSYFDEAILLNGTHPRTALDVATLSRQSADALELLVQMYAQRSPGYAETAVLKIYDWDYPAAATSLLSWIKAAEPYGPLPQPPRHLEVATFSLMAEKGLDLFQHTVRRFDAIRSSVEPVLRNRLQLPPGQYELPDLVRAIGKADLGASVPGWYTTWVRAFCQDMTFDELLALLQSDDGVLGWTASNILARSPLTEKNGLEIWELFSSIGAESTSSADRTATLRWRLVHAVGRSEWAVGFLNLAARDSSVEADVRYGAIRSLFSIALTSDASCCPSIDKVLSLDRAGLLREPRVCSAIRRCSIPASGVLPPSVEYWVASFEEMLGRHRDDLEASGDQAGALVWARRIVQFEAWKQSVES
jgi:hypothetical protein